MKCPISGYVIEKQEEGSNTWEKVPGMISDTNHLLTTWNVPFQATISNTNQLFVNNMYMNCPISGYDL